MYSLERFLQRLARHPSLSRTALFQNFLESTEWVRPYLSPLLLLSPFLFPPSTCTLLIPNKSLSRTFTNTNTPLNPLPLSPQKSITVYSITYPTRSWTHSRNSRNPMNASPRSDNTSIHSKKDSLLSNDSELVRKVDSKIYPVITKI